MMINADFGRRVLSRSADALWHNSPQPGVTRRLLDRVGDEVARATSVVRFAPQSHFPEHVHGGGEEILVLEGVFSDAAGDAAAGVYLRHPPGTRHAPFSADGCVIFVKLRQFAPGDMRVCRLDTQARGWARLVETDGVCEQPLHEYGAERVVLERWAASARCRRASPAGGEELYVIEGSLQIERERLDAGSWLRQPAGAVQEIFSRSGCLLYRKCGHLPLEVPPTARRVVSRDS